MYVCLQFSTVLMGCKTGEVYEYQIPTRVTDEQTFLTYNITDAHKLKSTRFVSVKSRIRRDQKREKLKKRKEKKRQRKLVEIDKLKAANPGLQIDLETALGRHLAMKEACYTIFTNVAFFRFVYLHSRFGTRRRGRTFTHTCCAKSSDMDTVYT